MRSSSCNVAPIHLVDYQDFPIERQSTEIFLDIPNYFHSNCYSSEYTVGVTFLMLFVPLSLEVIDNPFIMEIPYNTLHSHFPIGSLRRLSPRRLEGVSSHYVSRLMNSRTKVLVAVLVTVDNGHWAAVGCGWTMGVRRRPTEHPQAGHPRGHVG